MRLSLAEHEEAQRRQDNETPSAGDRQSNTGTPQPDTGVRTPMSYILSQSPVPNSSPSTGREQQLPNALQPPGSPTLGSSPNRTDDSENLNRRLSNPPHRRSPSALELLIAGSTANAGAIAGISSENHDHRIHHHQAANTSVNVNVDDNATSNKVKPNEELPGSSSYSRLNSRETQSSASPDISPKEVSSTSSASETGIEIHPNNSEDTEPLLGVGSVVTNSPSMPYTQGNGEPLSSATSLMNSLGEAHVAPGVAVTSAGRPPTTTGTNDSRSGS